MSAAGAAGPLDGIRVLELGTLIAGPFAGRLLGDMGADVIKVELPRAPDPLRTWGQAEVDGHHVFWTVHARNKRAITLDLRHPRGRELFCELVEKSDIVVENFRPGTLEKWGIGPADLEQAGASVMLLRISGFGQSGPYVNRPGQDLIPRHRVDHPGGRGLDGQCADEGGDHDDAQEHAAPDLAETRGDDVGEAAGRDLVVDRRP